MATGALVLAAGFSNRFGSVKLQASLSNGNSVLQQTLINLIPAVDDVLVVTRSDVVEFATATVNALQDTKVHCLQFEHPEHGMGATLAWGIAQAPKQWEQCLVCLSDMPFIRTASYQKLVCQLQHHEIVVPIHQNKLGNPAGFKASLFPQLKALSGDQGGRKIIRQNPQRVHELELDDPGVLADIDTPDDLQRYSALSIA